MAIDLPQLISAVDGLNLPREVHSKLVMGWAVIDPLFRGFVTLNNSPTARDIAPQEHRALLDAILGGSSLASVSTYIRVEGEHVRLLTITEWLDFMERKYSVVITSPDSTNDRWECRRGHGLLKQLSPVQFSCMDCDITYPAGPAFVCRICNRYACCKCAVAAPSALAPRSKFDLEYWTWGIAQQRVRSWLFPLQPQLLCKLWTQLDPKRTGLVGKVKLEDAISYRLANVPISEVESTNLTRAKERCRLLEDDIVHFCDLFDWYSRESRISPFRAMVRDARDDIILIDDLQKAKLGSRAVKDEFGYTLNRFLPLRERERERDLLLTSEEWIFPFGCSCVPPESALLSGLVPA